MEKESGLLDVAPLLLRMLSAAFISLITYPFRTTRSAALFNDVLYAAVRCMHERITIPQSRYLIPRTTAQYDAYRKSHSLPVNTETIAVSDSHGIDAHWIGSPSARHVILYLHGGGYTQPSSSANFPYLHRLIADFNADDAETMSLFMPAYTLAPAARYPTQLREAAATLSYLINDTGRSSSNIIISGDSAGGNLAFSLLSHLLHPLADVPSIKLAEPLRGMLLYSPWTSFSTDFPSFANLPLDVLPPLTLRKWSAVFLDKPNPTDPELDPGPVTGDAYTEPAANPASWWEGMHRIIDDVFVAYGGYEVLGDQIRMLEKTLKEGWIDGGGDVSRVTFVKGAREAHCHPIVDVVTLGLKEKSNTQMAVEEWYKARVGSV